MTCHQLYYELLFITFEGELCEESSVGEDEPVADPWPGSADPSLLDLESAIFSMYC